MAFGPGLKGVALKAHAEMNARIRDDQRGVPTFFDNAFAELLTGLVNSETSHQWDPSRPSAPPELKWLARCLETREKGRFVSYETRLAEGDDSESFGVGAMALLMSQGTSACLEWKGKPLFKTAFDFALLPMLIWELKPATIFEIGSGNGASAIWMADQLRSFNLAAQVYSTDIHPIAETYDGVRFLKGDCNRPDELFGAALSSAPHPWLVIEDAHVNVHSVLAHFDRFLAQGDYLFVEDSRMKAAEIAQFTGGRGNRYTVDTRYVDFFGRNATSAQNSIFRCGAP